MQVEADRARQGLDYFGPQTDHGSDGPQLVGIDCVLCGTVLDSHWTFDFGVRRGIFVVSSTDSGDSSSFSTRLEHIF